MKHKPVLLEETIQHLNLKPGMIVVDGTLGSAGHSMEMLKRIGEQGKLIALDQDPEAIRRCAPLLEQDPRVSLHNQNFVNLDNVLDSLNISSVDAVLLDVGFSSDQLEDGDRGFSFDKEGPLDMRMDPEQTNRAWDIVNRWPENELERIFFEYGNERLGRKFARIICQERRSRVIETTSDLVRVLQKALPYEYKKGSMPPALRRHPATRVFQALRIAVNNELGVLEEALPRIWKRVRTGGRFAVISFHSLEDRIVKRQFVSWRQGKEALAITKKPLTASREEEINNPRSRSAKLRVVERL